MSKRIVIAGAGGFGRNIFGWVTSSPRHREQHGISDIVFIDDQSFVTGLPAPLLGTIADYRPVPSDAVVCAIGDPHVRERLVTRLAGVGAQFHTFVDDRAIVCPSASVGEGAVLCPGVVVGADVQVGRQVQVNMNCSIGHDVSLGAFTTLSPAVNIMGEVVTGSRVFFGGSAVIMPRIELGDDVTVGAGAVVLRTLAPQITVVGNPARPLPRKTESDRA